MGRVTPFEVSAASPVARARFYLGLKALHNFAYAQCNLAFEAAIRAEPTFAMAYWGRALCNTQSRQQSAAECWWLEFYVFEICEF